MGQPDQLTKILAIYGAILSSFLACIHLIKFLLDVQKDRVHLRVTVKGDWKIYPLNTIYGDATYVCIKVANVGHRPVAIQTAGLLKPKNGFLVCTDALVGGGSKRLEEGDSRDFLLRQDDVEKKYGIRPREYVAFINDQAGRIFYSHNPLARFIRLGRAR